MIAAIERVDIIEVVRMLRSNPLTRHLSQTALSRLTGVSQSTISGWESGHRIPDPRRAVEVLQGLGVPGIRWGRRWLLPEEITNDTTPAPTTAEDVPAPCVTITAPGPIDVQVMRSTEDGDDLADAVAFVTDHKGPRLVVTPDRTWGVTNSSDGATAWFTVHNNEHPSLTAPEPDRTS